MDIFTARKGGLRSGFSGCFSCLWDIRLCFICPVRFLLYTDQRMTWHRVLHTSAASKTQNNMADYHGVLRLLSIPAVPSESGSRPPDPPFPSSPSWSGPPGSRALFPCRPGNPPRIWDFPQSPAPPRRASAPSSFTVFRPFSCAYSCGSTSRSYMASRFPLPEPR